MLSSALHMQLWSKCFTEPRRGCGWGHLRVPLPQQGHPEQGPGPPPGGFRRSPGRPQHPVAPARHRSIAWGPEGAPGLRRELTSCPPCLHPAEVPPTPCATTSRRSDTPCPPQHSPLLLAENGKNVCVRARVANPPNNGRKKVL